MTLVTPLRPHAPRRPGRPGIPPAIIRGSEPLPSLHVVEEIPGDLGVILWRSVRNVVLWSHTPAHSRATLFDPGAASARAREVTRVAPDADLLAPLSVVVALLESPERVEVRRLVNACRRVASWAEARGALGTALEFTQAAALASADDASLAVAVARLARRRAEYDRAESWYLRAIVLGRVQGDWRSYALGYLGLGNVHKQKGNYPGARRMLNKSLRSAARRGLPDVRGMAYHDLFACETDTGGGLEASTLAAEAFHAYGSRDTRVARLAYDVAYHWAHLACFAPAARIAEALIPHFATPGERALVLGLLARSAGGSADRPGFERARADLEELVESSPAKDGFAAALLGLSYGATSMFDNEVAVHSATLALEIATLRGEGRIRVLAEQALEAARAARVQAEPAIRGDRIADELADQFVRALTRGPAAVGV